MPWASYWKLAKFSSMVPPLPPNDLSFNYLSLCSSKSAHFLYAAVTVVSSPLTRHHLLFPAFVLYPFLRSVSVEVLIWFKWGSNAIFSVEASMVRHPSSSERSSPSCLLPCHMLRFLFLHVSHSAEHHSLYLHYLPIAWELLQVRSSSETAPNIR